MADNEDETDERINAARRRLLRNAVYVPPIIIGIVSLTQGCAAGSCSPATCQPAQSCRPHPPCNPNL
jgi:hypothetical protein